MAENESNEGKDLARSQKEVFEARVKQEVEKLKSGEEIIFNVNKLNEAQANLMTIKKVKDKAYIKVFGRVVAKYENDEFTYDKEYIKALEESESINTKQLGLPSLDEIEKSENLREDEEKESGRAGAKDDREELRDEDEERANQKDEQELNKNEKKKQENDKSDRTDWQEMELDREFSSSMNLRMWLRDNCGVQADKLFRVPEKDGHGFKYIAENSDGEEQELPLSTDIEGKNSRQKIYIINKEGKLEEKDVDSLLLTQNGDYGLATDRPENVSQDHTKTYIVRRTKGGQYVAMEAMQKNTRDRESSNDEDVKEIADDRRKSVYDVEETADNMEESNENDEIAEDGVTAEEINIKKQLEKEGYTEREIYRIFGYMNDKKLDLDKAKERIQDERDEDYVGYGQARPH